MSNPLFSIITVTWNAQATIGRTMASVTEQSCTDYEHLIIDGLSTDDTLKIVGAKGDKERVKVVSQKDTGIYDAMNKGIGLARGQYLIFLNSGDCFHDKNTLATIAEAIKNPISRA